MPDDGGRSETSDFGSVAGKSISTVLEMKTALEDEHLEFVCI